MLRYYFKIFNINKEGEYLIHLNTKNNLENRIKRKKEKMLKNKKICDLLYKLNILKIKLYKNKSVLIIINNLIVYQK